MAINLYNKDSFKVISKMRDNSFDLAIVDPPYNYKKGTSGFVSVDKNFKEDKFYSVGSNYKLGFFTKEMLNEIMRVSVNQIIFGGNFITEHLPSTSCWLIWHKKNIGNRFSDAELMWTSFNTTVRIFEETNSRDNGNRIHPTQKPVKLYKWLLKNYANEGDKILDTHLGSGAIAIACHDLHFDLEGYEIDPTYYKAALDRLRTHQAQLQIF